MIRTTASPSDQQELDSEGGAVQVGSPMRRPLAPRTLVILPAWNEEANVAEVVQEIQGCASDYEVLVVDDGSTDATAIKAEESGAHVLRLPFNIGVGGAVRAGLLFADREGYDAVVQVDADGQHDPAYIPRLIGELHDADLVIGARFAGVGQFEVSRSRRFTMWFLGRVVSRVCGTRLTDTTSGFRAFSPRAVGVLASLMPAEYLGDTIEATVIASRFGCKVVQVPVEMRPRATGTSSRSSGRAIFDLARQMMAVGMARVRRY